jgi:16S rRNA (adenine1518-N6/adenine1519-N6)-dimethyltransferase
MYAKKSLGQHFLTSEGAVDALLKAGEVQKTDTILEVGPGKGVLTKKLLKTGARVIAVEKDDNLIELLSELFKKELKSGQFVLIHEDILEFNPMDTGLETGKFKIIANIPYYITGQFIRLYLESEIQPERMVLMVQKEVAERIVAKNNKESILSISVKAYGTPRYVQMVRAGSFSPAPNVDSAILSIENISKEFFVPKISEERFFELLRAGFKSKRKKLSSNLSNVVSKENVQKVFLELNMDENTRAEDINTENWKKLASLLTR